MEESDITLSTLEGLESTLITLLTKNKMTQDSPIEHYRDSAKNLINSQINLFSENRKHLSDKNLHQIKKQCLWYGCCDYISRYIDNKIKNNILAKEEAILYLQDILQRDGYRLIEKYNPNRGTFKNYINKIIETRIIDFWRKKQREFKTIDVNRIATQDDHITEMKNFSATYASPDYDFIRQNESEEYFTGNQLKLLVQMILGTTSPDIKLKPNGELNQIRKKIGVHLNLTAKQRMFLRALFQYDVNINKMHAMPGFDFGMDINGAYNYFWNIKKEIREAVKRAGVFEELRETLISQPIKIAVHTKQNEKKISLYNILYIKQGLSDYTECYIIHQNNVIKAKIEQAFSRFRKKYSYYFAAIQTSVAIADVHVDRISKCHLKQGFYEVKINHINDPLEVSPRYWHTLNSRLPDHIYNG